MHAQIFELEHFPARLFTYVDGQDPAEAVRAAIAAAGLGRGPVGVEDSLPFADADFLTVAEAGTEIVRAMVEAGSEELSISRLLRSPDEPALRVRRDRRCRPLSRVAPRLPGRHGADRLSR